MFDTFAVAQQLAAGGVDRDQAEVIAKATHDGFEHGNHVKTGRAEVRAKIANLISAIHQNQKERGNRTQ